MNALDIVSMLIKCLMTSVKNDVERDYIDCEMSYFEFVLAVPATNGEGAKLFIREAAKKVH